MTYTLLKNENIITGPRDWHQGYFEHFISEELNQQVTVENAPTEPLIFNESLKLVPTQVISPTELNPAFDQIAGPRFYYDEFNNHIAEFYPQEFPIDSIKANLKSALANLRWVKETTQITRDINGKTLTLYTDRETRTIYSTALSLVNDDYSAQWKFPEGFYAINKSDLQTIVNCIMQYVQECFTWEFTKTSEIDAFQTTAELREYDLEK